MTASQCYEGLPFERYLELPGESSTGLKALCTSPLLYSCRQEHGLADKDTLRVGRAAHTATLEPARFETDFVTWTGGTRRGKEWDAFRREHEARTILTEAQVEVAIQVAAAVHAHPVAGALLAEPGGKAELSITWTHERTGLQCKSRIDWLCSSLVDLKSCRDPSPALFASASARLLYHVQMAFYSAALSTLGLDLPVKMIAVQNVAPFDVVVYDVGEDVILVGEQLYEAALDKVLACRASGSWPGVAPLEAVPLKLPIWAVPQIDDDDMDLDQEGWSVALVKEA